MQYAEDKNYWNTTVSPGKSQGEIMDLFDDFGVKHTILLQGRSNGKTAWLIRFVWNSRRYRFLLSPFECRDPQKIFTFGGKRRTAAEQAVYQMGRRAFHFVKALLTVAMEDEAALFGFLELNSANAQGIPLVTSEMPAEFFQDYADAPPEFLLDSGIIDGEVSEVQ